MGDKRRLFNDDSAYKLLQKARIHLLFIPHFIFIGIGIITILMAIQYHDYKIIITGYIIAILTSQLYWSRMVVVWKLKVFKHQQFRILYREAIKEVLIYPEHNWFSNLIIATNKEKNEIKTKRVSHI